MVVVHGKSFITTDEDIITIKAVGAFNLEGINKVISELKLVIESFNGRGFKLLFDYAETEGGTPDVYEKINDCNIWLNSQNMIAKALIITSSTNLAILESRTPARKSQNSQHFKERESAIAWLNLQG